MKYVRKDSAEQASHWAACERARQPYIEVADHGKDHSVVFYDVTNLPVDLEAVSDALRRIYAAYIEFFRIDDARVADLMDQPYLFTLLVRREHAGCIADALFDYLAEALARPPA